jgi:outer membrane protein assembly factor BamB
VRTRIALLAAAAALVLPAAAAAFDNTEPLAAKQWYLTEDRAWSFDGVPVGDGQRLYVAMRRSDVNPQAAVACFDAATGRQLWRTAVGSANTPAAGLGDEVTHNLLTLVGERVYFGAICWLRQYERSKGTVEAPGRGPRAHFQRGPTPAMYYDGMVVVAPSDTPRVFALDSETGREIWSSEELGPRETGRPFAAWVGASWPGGKCFGRRRRRFTCST